MTDHAGHTINVGDVVNLTLTVTAVNNFDPHFAGVVCTPSFPSPNTVPGVNTSNTGVASSNAQLPCNYAFDGSQLTYVSGP